MFLKTWHLSFSQPTQPTFLSNGYNLDLTMQSFILLALLYDTIGGGEKTCWTCSSLYKNGIKSLLAFQVS